jgi:hypothetical protein
MHFALSSGIDLPTDYKFWENQCLTLLGKSDELYVLTLPGWCESTGVQSEIYFAQLKGLPFSLHIPALLGG